MRLSNLKIPLFFAAAKLLLHIFTNTSWSFHRDEFLYLALGRHPELGFWSNPPLIGFISFINQSILGDGLFATRLVPAIFGSAVVFFTCLIARDLGGKKYAQILVGVASFSSLAFLRSSHMFMPVIIDIFFWTLASWLLLRYLKSEKNKWLLWLGAAVGFGFLNKYSVVFLMAAMSIALLLTPARRIFLKKHFWWAAGLALLIVSPNLWWQWDNNFPVIYHMNELSENQLSTVSPFIFLLDQLLMHLWSLIVWLPGVYFLLRNIKMKKYRPLGWFFLATIFIFLAMSGKNYYTLGAFPVVMGAGAIFWENTLNTNWKKWSLAGVILIGNMVLLPVSLPILSVDNSIAYFQKLGVESLTRWERGNIEALPQDYADMLGWQEMAALADEAVRRSGDPEHCLIYAENYGQAGAVQYFGKHKEKVVSFSDSYRIWMPNELPPDTGTFIYINDEMGDDVKNLFAEIELIGEVKTEHARERGTQVYLCQNPKSSFPDFWAQRVKEVKTEYGME